MQAAKATIVAVIASTVAGSAGRPAVIVTLSGAAGTRRPTNAAYSSMPRGGSVQRSGPGAAGRARAPAGYGVASWAAAIRTPRSEIRRARTSRRARGIEDSFTRSG